jgi:ParB-like chromosome segregation protein Spo0J
MVQISSLRPGDSPRSSRTDPAHIAQLAEIDGPLPPILVERRTLRVIDGQHRLLAAVARGARTIEVEFFDGSGDDAFLRAVEANVAHGLPLSSADRRAAAERIVASHPHMSDRAIARAAGLGARTVAAIRRRTAEAGPLSGSRMGRDGKVRPLSGAEGRRRAAELIAERPHASLREVARLAGISPATVSDVRKRLASGEAPAALPEAVQPAEAVTDEAPPTPRLPDAVPAQRDRRSAARQVRLVKSDTASVVEKLLRDPSLRHKEEGRQLLRLLQQNALGTREWSELTAVVPSHCRALVVDVARQCAQTWLEFAQELDQRVGAVDRAQTLGS